jgi:16S rRNA (cytidine1402-2'-O)-methyltransferase
MIVDSVASENPLNSLSVAEHLNHYLDLGMDKKDAVKQVAKDRGIPKNEVYQQALNM